MRVIFFGTSSIAAPFLRTLIKHHEIAGVITAPDAKAGRSQALLPSPVSKLAGELNLPVYKPETVKGNQKFQSDLKRLAPDLSLVVDYGKILPEEILDLPKLKTINIHFSLLPKYRGPSPIQTALLEGKTETGASIFILDKNIDAGPILAQTKLAIADNDTSAALSQKLIDVSLKFLLQIINRYATGAVKPVIQDESQATYTKLIAKTDGKINWQKSAPEIYNQFRAFYQWPGIWTTWQGRNLKILDCLPITPLFDHEPFGLEPRVERLRAERPAPLTLRERQPLYSSPLFKGEIEGVIPGIVLNDGVVACGNQTFLQISRLQLAGKPPTDIKSFLNGHKKFIGSQLG